MTPFWLCLFNALFGCRENAGKGKRKELAGIEILIFRYWDPIKWETAWSTKHGSVI